ncbi:discoidin domain-containing protein [Cohnella panacarvi]|uniref:discoidin domain-containing protein n=1 Tax=Cohnella panacarvi TaxID=400776 RepID=UPI00047A4511|nr:discoidin domain-containing protein [Cohnella panacarvi]
MTKRMLNKKWVWISSSAVVVAAVGVLLLFADLLGGRANASMAKRDGLLVISNSDYEIAFDASHGGVSYIKDKNAEGSLTHGNREGALWWAIMNDDTSVSSAKTTDFTYDWNGKKSELTFRYGGSVQVDIKTRFGDDRRIYMNAGVLNGSDLTIKSFRFPYELKVEVDGVKDAMLPMLPGAKLKNAFFKDSNSFSDQYPGVMFASYLAMRTNAGSMAVYDIGGSITPLTEIGYKSQTNDKGKTAFVHSYRTWIESKAEWKSPDVVLEIGGDYPSSIASYRKLNAIDKYRTLGDKLGEDADVYFQLPLYKTDISAIKDADWSNLTSNFIDKMNYPGMIHLVGFQTGGHDENYPDFIPPDPRWGSSATFEQFVKRAKDKGNRIVPYTNMSWWGKSSPTLANLPAGTTLESLVVQKENKTIASESYGMHEGYVVNPADPFFLRRTGEEHDKLINVAGFDGVFEDQWGIRNSPYVYNDARPAGTDPSTAYFAGVRQYFDALKHRIYIEDGTDVLADDSIGFMGATYLWDLLGYRKNTAIYTDYYPLAGMLFRDKVMQYQHNLAGETMTDDQDLLRWNVAMGYNLSADFYNGVSSPWVDAVGVFQKFVLSRYADSLAQGFEQVAPAVTRTDFGTHRATANWDTKQPYALDAETTLSAGGFDIVAEDGAVRAGNYSRYNGFDLDIGEHDLVEARGEDSIRVYQPIGSDTTLKIKKGDGWPFASAAAYEADGTKIAELRVKNEGDYAIFDYVGVIKERKVAYVELKRSEAETQVAETFEKAKLEVNIAAGTKALATSVTAEAFDPKLTTDGDPFTYWESTANKFPQSLTVDLGSEMQVGKVMLALPPQDAWEARDQEIEVLGSADGRAFASLLPAKPYTFDPKRDNKIELPLESAVKQRFIRVTMTSNTAWPAAQISEIEVYE